MAVAMEEVLQETPEELVRRIAKKHSLTVEALRGSSRLNRLVKARREVYAALRASPWEWSYSSIGDFMGGRDSSSIIHALRRAKPLATQEGKS